MEVVQGNSKDKKIVIAQEIAFAKVLAGNNKTLRDRAIKKLKKWLTIRGNGNWEFTEEEFLRIWTGLFYCMWMSDKFLVQEELAESISKLIHCFKKNSHSALLFIKCYNKRILMDWDGLDQYRTDKFQMLTRRFLRQTFIYCKEKDWDESLLNKLTGIFYNVILHSDSSLGFVLHFISIYPQELTKVGNGKLDSKIVLKLIEPFVKLLARSKDLRILKETEDFFTYLMSQTDTGIEFEERFNAWKEQGCPGEGPHCLVSVEVTNKKEMPSEIENDTWSEEEDEEDEDSESRPLDPRAGSVDVFLPQLTIDIDGLINLFQKHQNSKQSEVKGRKLLRSLIQKFQTIKRGRFPVKVRKNPELLEKRKKRRQTEKNAKELMKFTCQLDEEPIRTEEYKDMLLDLEHKEDKLEKEDADEKRFEVADEDHEFFLEDETQNDNLNEKKDGLQLNLKKRSKKNKKALKKIKGDTCIHSYEKTDIVRRTKSIIAPYNKSDQNTNSKQNLEKWKKKKKSSKAKLEKNSTQPILAKVVKPKKKLANGAVVDFQGHTNKPIQKVTPVHKAGVKRKILSNWQVQELDTCSPEYYKIETPKIITVERKIPKAGTFKENEPHSETVKKEDSEENAGTATQKEFFPVFWEKAKAKAKANRANGRKNKVFMNPFAKIEEESKTPIRRISFALEKNMAQENEQYLEEIKNSPRVPFDGSKKPVQSALKSGLAPSPVNPFYRFKKIKLQGV